MNLNDIICETPMLIGEWSPEELENDDQNAELYYQLLPLAKHELYKIDDIASIYLHNNTLFCLDTSINRVTYEMQFKLGKNIKLGQYVWQASVWRNLSVPNTLGWPEKIFFEYLLPTYHVIITDSQQSFDGRKFWMNRIANAFNRNLNVYYCDFSSNKLTKIEDSHHWVDFHRKTPYIWSKQPASKMKRMVITDKVVQ